MKIAKYIPLSYLVSGTSDRYLSDNGIWYHYLGQISQSKRIRIKIFTSNYPEFKSFVLFLSHMELTRNTVYTKQNHKKPNPKNSRPQEARILYAAVQVLHMKPCRFEPTNTEEKTPLTTVIYQSTYFWEQSWSVQVFRQLMLLKLANASLKQDGTEEHIKQLLRWNEVDTSIAKTNIQEVSLLSVIHLPL